MADRGRWWNVQIKSSPDGATELSFLTSHEQKVLRVVISSSATKNGRSFMPSAVSSDGSIKVHSSVYLHRLADSIAACISKRTDAYTMLAEAVWDSMKECRDCTSYSGEHDVHGNCEN